MTPRETLSYHFERNVAEPRINHQIVLETSKYGQTLREVAIAYGRKSPDRTLPTQWDQDAQTKTYLRYTTNQVTNDIDDVTVHPHTYRLPINCERRLYELTGFAPGEAGNPFSFDQFFPHDFQQLEAATEIGYEKAPDLSVTQKRLLKMSRTVCRSDDLARLLPLREMGALCIPGQKLFSNFHCKLI